MRMQRKAVEIAEESDDPTWESGEEEDFKLGSEEIS